MIDTTFDFRTGLGPNDDPDMCSTELHEAHQALWCRPWRGRVLFDIDGTYGRQCLHHKSVGHDYFLSSDSIIPTYTYWDSMQHIVGQVTQQEQEEFLRVAYTIGGFIVFPCEQIDGHPTINTARGFTHRIKIADRMDLTLECIRRHYASKAHPMTDDLASPMSDDLARYAHFFDLFESFDGYVDFFLLGDLMDGDQVKFFMSFEGFQAPAVPQNLSEYELYRAESLKFLKARNKRVAALGV